MKLGDKVRVSDYLVRVRPDSRSVSAILDAWKDMPEDLRRWLESPRSRGGAKLWVPNSVLMATQFDAYTSRDTRNNPAPYDLPLPVEGVVTQKVTLQNGVPDHDEFGSGWDSAVSVVGYKVAYHLSRRPITVLPTMITPLEEGMVTVPEPDLDGHGILYAREDGYVCVCGEVAPYYGLHLAQAWKLIDDGEEE